MCHGIVRKCLRSLFMTYCDCSFSFVFLIYLYREPWTFVIAFKESHNIKKISRSTSDHGCPCSAIDHPLNIGSGYCHVEDDEFHVFIFYIHIYTDCRYNLKINCWQKCILCSRDGEPFLVQAPKFKIKVSKKCSRAEKYTQ